MVGLLEGERGHLVGHSYGGVVAMLAAIRRPDLVDSLTLIQPGAMRPAEDHPVVAAMLARGRAAQESAADEQTPSISAEDYIRASTEGMGMSAPELTPRRLRAATTSIGERPCWDAEVPLEPLAAAPFPILMISGDWANAPEEYRRLAGEPLMAVADVIADRVGARHLRVPGYYPQVDAAVEVNAALRELWRGIA